MKHWVKLLLLMLALVVGMGVQAQAQTLKEAYAAYEGKDYRTAFSGYRKLAEQGNAVAQFFTGLMYDEGKGVPKDERKAVVWFRKAAEQGHSNAQYYLGLMYAKGQGVPKDEQQVVAWFRKAAESGNVFAQYNLAMMYNKGRGVPQDKKEAVVWYRKSADQEFGQAQFDLGYMYAEGEGVAKDEQQAVVWYTKAAEQGHTSAQYNLSVMYHSGRGVPKDEEQAVAWMRKAAEQGFEQAQERMGSRYDTGQGVTADKQQALEWYRKAAEHGNASAQNTLGTWYLVGIDVPKDVKQAVAWYRKAAEQGDADGQNSLGSHYSDGVGVLKDEKQAVAWYRRAAEQGNAKAQRNLGFRYAIGTGVPKDLQMAYFWWLLGSTEEDKAETKSRNAFLEIMGSKTKYEDTSQLRDAVERTLSPEQRAAAQSDARNWKPKNAAQSMNLPESSAGAGGFEPVPGREAPVLSRADSTGSGFRVAPGAIVTNHHVIDGCSRLRVNGAAAQLRGSDARSDLALVSVTLAGTSASLRAQRAAVGEPVAVAGYPLRGLLSGFNMTTGTLSSLSGAGGDTRLLQITAPVQPGNSGGPALDSAGNLLGVVVSKLDAIKTAKITGDIPQNVNFAINTNVLRSFLDANSVDYETSRSDKPLLSTVIAEKAKGFTVLVECWK